ncbi:hypothetical protein [Streptomyces griseus]|uniref:hypothetical protein n=1 Tax=Streptomyces griseus TaxID=1911 RepID=UPI0005656719|nr:hypothetical protein [Streptomyces griseus]
MPVLGYHYGPDWTEELYQVTLERVFPDPDDLPSGLIAHYAAPAEGGGWQVVDIWESREQHDRFIQEKVLPVAKEFDAPPFETKVTEIYNVMVPADRS